MNCVPNAVKQTVLAAKPVYAFLGAARTVWASITNHIGTL